MKTFLVPAQAAGEVQRPGLWEEFSLYHLAPTEAHDEQFPILFFLHGTGRHGPDPAQVQGLPPLAAAVGGHGFPFIIAAPQVREGRSTGESRVQDELEVFFEDVIKMTNADQSRICLVGQSVGGRGAWDLLMRKPDYFAAAVPIEGASGTVPKASTLTEVPIWAFHGRLDDVVPVESSIELIDTIRAAGVTQARITIYEDGGHSVWWQALAKDAEVYDWLLSQQNGTVPEPSSMTSVLVFTAVCLNRRTTSRL